MRKWLQATLGGKSTSAKDEEHVDKAILELLEEKKKKGIAKSIEPADTPGAPPSASATSDNRRETGDTMRDALHEMATKASAAAESPWSTKNASAAQRGMCGAQNTSKDQDENGWTCRICNQRENTGSNCSVCHRPRGANLNRSYMTVNEITQDVVDGLKRQRDHHYSTQPIAARGARTDAAWNSGRLAPSIPARTQEHESERRRETLPSALPSAGLATTQKSATFSGASRSAGTLPMASTVREKIGPAPPLPSFKSWPSASTQHKPRSGSPTPVASYSTLPSASVQNMSRSSSVPDVHRGVRASVSERTQSIPTLPSGSAHHGSSSSSTSSPLTQKHGDSRSPSGTPPTIKPGSVVTVNGSVGTTRGWDRNVQRYIVDFPGGETKSVKKENMQVMSNVGVSTGKGSVLPPTLSNAAKAALAEPQRMLPSSPAHGSSAIGMRKQTLDVTLEKCPPVTSKFGFTLASSPPIASRSHLADKLAPLPQATMTPTAANSRSLAGSGSENLLGNQCPPFPPARLKSPPPAPSQEPAFQRQASRKREEPLAECAHFSGTPAVQTQVTQSSRSTLERGGVTSLPPASMQSRPLQQSQRRSAPASGNNPSPVTHAGLHDDDPMSMLMSQMQNLNRIQNRMQTHFA